MNLIHNLIYSTGWFSNTDPTPAYTNGEQDKEIEKAMDSDSDELRGDLVHSGYNTAVEKIRETEYPQLQG